MNDSQKKWVKAFAISLLVFLILSIYLYLRRGYYNIYIINKVFGSSAVILAGITLLIGPLRQFPSAIPFMTVRRQLGLVAFGFAVFHVVFSLYQTDRFEWFSWYMDEWLAVLFGVTALAIWGYMAYISRNKRIQEMGADIWKRYLSLTGKIAFLAIFIHLTVMKYPGWMRWFQGQTKQTDELANPSYPPASLFIFLFMSLVIVYRIFHFFKYRKYSIQQEK